MLGVQGHLLDEPELVPAVQAEPQQRRGFIVIDAAYEDRVDFERCQPGGGSGGQAGQYIWQPVPMGERGECLRGQGVERDVEPVQPGYA